MRNLEHKNTKKRLFLTFSRPPLGPPQNRGYRPPKQPLSTKKTEEMQEKPEIDDLGPKSTVSSPMRPRLSDGWVRMKIEFLCWLGSKSHPPRRIFSSIFFLSEEFSETQRSRQEAGFRKIPHLEHSSSTSRLWNRTRAPNRRQIYARGARPPIGSHPWGGP